jgi:hypothetical protein
MLQGDRRTFFSRANPDFPWYRAWLTAVLRPSLSGYQTMLEGLNRASGDALIWVYMGTAILTGLLYASGSTWRQLSTQVLVCGPFVIGLFGVVGFLLGMGVVHLASTRLFGGTGAFSEILFLAGSIYAPLLIVHGLIGLAIDSVPYVQVVGYGVALFQVALITVAAKAVYRLGWGLALVSVVPVYSAFWLCNQLV